MRVRKAVDGAPGMAPSAGAMNQVPTVTFATLRDAGCRAYLPGTNRSVSIYELVDVVDGYDPPKPVMGKGRGTA